MQLDKASIPLVWLVSALISAVSFSCVGAWVTAGAWFSVKTDIHELRADVKLLKKKAGIEDPSAFEENASSTSNPFGADAFGAVKTHAKTK